MIDYYAEARRLISDETLEVTPEGDEVELFAAAQVHATLALVEATEKVAEQARIANEHRRVANLIAYASHRLFHKSAVGNDYSPALVGLLANADFEIRKGLRL